MEDERRTRPRRRAGLPRRLAGDRSGATAVEFALLAFPFFLTIFALLEVALLFVAELTLDAGVDRIGREIRTGQTFAAQPTREEFRQALCSSVGFLLDCDKLKIDLATYTSYGAIEPGPPRRDGRIDDDALRYEIGGASEIVALRVYYEWPIVTNVMRQIQDTQLLTGMTAFRTEAF
ncbi:TadE/TadG family type IV pilus assembly protein [Aureimonas populi]|uniref:TadE/TadG family type IV pilus assembly protein n=1 Tax=Aureimonas populi TaxID=1701758 RepID=A0ABW5CKZ4_9HYPH|nr:TadE/TadG family type IV pilus assembly protein [Aureimonas populi]